MDEMEKVENLSEFGCIEIQSEQNISAFIDSRIGGRNENQDSAGFQDTKIGAVIVVCDGMGGTYGGRMASTIAVRTILEVLSSVKSKDADKRKVLKRAIWEANERIISYGQENPSYSGMGTTATILIISEQSALVAYVGDSRVYQLRGKKKIFRTFDHSMVFEMVKRKALTEEQARLSAQSNVILKALGVSQDIEPGIYELPYQKNDRFILCTDGFWSSLPEESFLQMVGKRTSPDKVLAAAMEDIDQIGHDNGGKHDNLTAAFVDVKQNSILKEQMNNTAKIIIAILSVCLLISLIFNFAPDRRHVIQNNMEQTNEDVPSITAWRSTDASEQKWNKSYRLLFNKDTALMLVTQHNPKYNNRVDTVKLISTPTELSESKK